MKTIKKFWFVMLALVVALSSCDLLANLTQDVDIDAPDVEFTVQNSAVSDKSKVSSVANVETPVVLLDRTVNLDIAQQVKDVVDLDLNTFKGLKLKKAIISTTTDSFDMTELSGLKMYFGNEATEENLVAQVSSTTNTLAILEILNNDVYDKLGTDDSLRIIITNPHALTLPSVDLILATQYTVTIEL